MTKKSYIQAITDALDIMLKEDPKTLIFGEDVGKNGGVFRTTQGLQEKYGKDRVFDTPLAESGIMGLAIGLGLTDWRPIPEIQFSGFTFEAVDSIAGQMARMRFRFNNKKHSPITIRSPYGGGTHTAEMHSDNLENFFTGVPGLRVVMPSNPYDAKGLLISSIENNDPVLFLENLKLYRSMKADIPDEKYTVPLDQAKVVQAGNDITIVAYGAQVQEAQHAAEDLSKENISCEVIDLCTVSPIDTATIFQSIAKTHKVVIVQEAQKMAGVGAQVASEIGEKAIMSLDAPIGRVAAPNTIYPFALAEEVWIPRKQAIIDKVKEIINY